MTTLEKIEKAVGEVAANGHEDVRHVLSPAAIERVVRAVLMAVIPTLERVEVEEQGPPGRGWLDGVSSSDGEYVRYEDLAAILAEDE